jgi:hypothetical protein
LYPHRSPPTCFLRPEAGIRKPGWIETTDRRTWITAIEILVLGAVLITVTGSWIALLVGGPILMHLGWSALTSVPVGAVPGPPPGLGERRRNHHLRYRVVAFLNEVQRVEEFVQSAKSAGLPRHQVERNLRSAEHRLQSTAAEVVKVVGQAGV